MILGLYCTLHTAACIVHIKRPLKSIQTETDTVDLDQKGEGGKLKKLYKTSCKLYDQIALPFATVFDKRNGIHLMSLTFCPNKSSLGLQMWMKHRDPIGGQGPPRAGAKPDGANPRGPLAQQWPMPQKGQTTQV